MDFLKDHKILGPHLEKLARAEKELKAKQVQDEFYESMLAIEKDLEANTGE